MLSHMGKLLVRFRPLAIELRLLDCGIGGILKVIAVELMDVLQNILGNIWKTQNLFKVASSTSVGGFDDLTLALLA